MFSMILSIIIFFICLAFIVSEKINKAIVAIAGASICLVCHLVDQHDAFHLFIDWNVIFLLIGMMIMVGIIKDSGIFEYIAIFLAKKAHGSPKIIIVVLSIISGVFAALIGDIAVAIIMVPISILIAIELGLSPLPFVIAQAIATNIGSAATLIGDPSNLMIGSARGFTFLDYILNAAPLVAFLLIVTSALNFYFFKKELVVTNERRARIMEFREKELLNDMPLIVFSIITFVIFITLLVLQQHLNYSPATIALAAAVMLLLKAKKIDFEKFICNEIHWSTILFFIGLFIMVGSLEETGFISMLSDSIVKVTGDNPKLLAVFLIWFTGIVAACIDNIPYVATMIHVVGNITQDAGVWWAFVFGAVMSGNGSMIGSSSNIISVSISKKSGYAISFWTFTKYSALTMGITYIFSTLYVVLRYF
ncbi:MAG: SLC13 family permease [Candidatus Cloacimonetes bacterium]|nr:SLC13 family permease [Candidatus Cloacimonadota bacterium]